jgi:hypothetical protein
MKKINFLLAFIFICSNEILSTEHARPTLQNQAKTPQLQPKDFWKSIDDLLIQDGKYPSRCLQNEIFKAFHDNKDISPCEKSKYIEENVKKLAPIFFLLNAVYLSKCGEYKKAGIWYVFGMIRTLIDQEKCTDLSVAGTTGALLQTTIFPDLDIGVSKDNPEKYQTAWVKWLDESWEDGLALHKNTQTEVKYPYWLASLGMKVMIAGMNEKTVDSASLFKPENQWDALEALVVRNMQASLRPTGKTR